MDRHWLLEKKALRIGNVTHQKEYKDYSYIVCHNVGASTVVATYLNAPKLLYLPSRHISNHHTLRLGPSIKTILTSFREMHVV